MHFKRLEIQGFKTFATRAVFEFRPGITAIVGPNGSGKSNIADAVRWVLGEQSFTALRCKRTEELLFSGGGRRPPSGLAEVSLTIDNSDRLLPLAFDEVTVTRRATRAGDNEYFINRARVRLRDLHASTEPLGGSYTIINQGLVDAALTLRPEERRRLFEDAAEIGGFELRKAEALRRLRETNTNIQRIADLLGDMEPRLRVLKRQAAQARAHRELSAELHTRLTHFYTFQGQAAYAAYQAAQQRLTRLGSDLEQARLQQSHATSETRARREELRHLREYLGNLHQQSSALHLRAEAAQRDLAVADERLAALSRRAEEFERTRNDLEVRVAEVRRDHAAAHAALTSAENSLAEQQALLAACEAELAAYTLARQALDQELADAQAAVLAATTAAARQRSRVEEAAAQRTRLQQEQADLSSRIVQAEAHVTALRQQQETAHVDVQSAEVHLAAVEQTLTQAQAQIQSLRDQRASADERLAVARRALADLEARLESLSRLARSYSGTFAGVRMAMQWAERAGRTGFALVSSIVHTPAELETAIEVALGARLQNIVVARWQDAEDAIAELKRSDAGRATFLPLDTLRQSTSDRRRADHYATDDAVPGVAADLVSYDPAYHAVVQHLLGRVLVVRDMPTARRELRDLSGGWMLVTLSGEQVQSSGTITGGARTKETGTLRRERELRELPQQVAAARAHVAAIEAEHQTLEQHLDQATRAVRETERQYQLAGRDLASRRTSLDTINQRVAQAVQELDWQHGRLTALERDQQALDAQERNLADQHAQANAQVAAAEAHLASLRTRQEGELQADRTLQTRLTDLRAAVATVRGQVKTEQSLAATHQQNLERMARQQAEATRRLADLASERVQVEAARAQAAAAHQALSDELETLRTHIGPAESDLHAREANLSHLETSETHATERLLELETSHNQAALEAQRTQDRQHSLIERASADGITLNTQPSIAADPPHDRDNLPDVIQNLRDRIARLGTINPLALTEYEETAERRTFLQSQIDDLRQAETTLQALIRELDATMHDRFAHTFSAVATEFEKSFTRIFGGGTARLRLVGSDNGAIDGVGDPGDPEADRAGSLGVEIQARPPGKRQQNISLLSGGERALTAAALLFAILKVNPSPFCILDEVDAALDEANVGRFRDVLADLTSQTQFILITHNRGTIEAADTLYGITMGDDGASRVLSMRIDQIEAQ